MRNNIFVKIFLKIYFLIILSGLPSILLAGSNPPNNIAGQWADSQVSTSHTPPRTFYVISEDHKHHLSGKAMSTFFDSGQINEITFGQNKLHFKMGTNPSNTVVFDGKLSGDGSKIEGHFISNENNYEITLYRLIPNPYRSMTNMELQTKIDKGDGKAMAEMGYRHYYADGAEMDLEKAEKLFRQAADLRIPNKLCLNWYFGIGFKKDLPFAFKCFNMINAYDWIAYMRYKGLGVPKNTALAIDGLYKVLKNPKLLEIDNSGWSMEAFDENDKRQGLVFVPDYQEQMTELLNFMEDGKPGSYSNPSLDPTFPSCFLADNGHEDSGCTNDESSVIDEKVAVLARVFFSTHSPEDRMIFEEYQKKFEEYQTKSAESAGFLSEGGTMQGEVESGMSSGLGRDHHEEVQKILQKNLEYTSPEANFKKADAQLNVEYKKLMAKANKIAQELPELKDRNPDYSPNVFKKSELAWLAYLDSAVKLIGLIYANDPHKIAVIEKFKIDATLKQTENIKSYMEQ